jgi:hypothetical protein
MMVNNYLWGTFMLQRPIFIGGISGTGKTIVRLILSSHSNIALTRRFYFWTRFYKRFGDLHVLENFERCLAAILQEEQVRSFNPDIAKIRSEFFQGQLTYIRLFGVILKQFAEMRGKKRWGIQLGSTERYSDEIFSSYPDARILQMIRDPYDRYKQFRSMYRRKFGSLGRSTVEWLASVDLALENRNRHPERYRLVKYEELTSSLEATISRICEFLGEEFTNEMLSPKILQKIEAYNQSSSWGGATANYEDMQKVSSMNLWVNLGTAFTQAITKRRMLAVDYQTKDVNLTFLTCVFFYAMFFPANLIIGFLWRLRYRKFILKGVRVF